MSEAQFKLLFDRISPLAAGYCVCFGLVVLIGWVFNIDFLKNPMPHQFPISPVVAFCFICAGSSLLLGRQGNIESKTALRVAACVIFALIFLVMLAYITGGILDIEQAILPYPLGGIAELAPGRISFHGALGMFLVSICLFLLSLEQKCYLWAQRIACLVGLLGYFTVIGYVYNLPMLYSTTSYTRIAQLAGFGFVVLALAVLFYFPYEGLAAMVTKTGPAAVLARRLLPAALLVPLALGAIRYSFVQLGLLEGDAGAVFMLVAETTVMLVLIGITSSAVAALDKERRVLKEQKDKFVSVLIHDLQEPLASSERLVENLRIVQFETLTAQQKESFAQLKATNAELLQKIKNLLEFHRLEKELGIANFSAVNVVPAVQRVCERFKEQAQLQNKEIKVSLPDDMMPKVMGDEAALEQVLSNLLQNALKFTDEGGSIELSVNALKFLVDIQVRDNGKGMSEEDQEKLFKAFNMGVAGGQVPSRTGLGLYLCDQIVKAHNGHLTCMSEIDRGTTFVMTLPLATSPGALSSAEPSALG